MLNKLTLIFLFLLCFESHAAESSASLKKIKEDYEKTKRSLDAIEVKKREVMGRFFNLGYKIEKIVREKGRLTDEMLVLNSDAKNVAKKIAHLEKQTSHQKSRMRKRIGALHKLSGQTYLRMIFSTSNTDKTERNLRFLSLMAERDLELIKEYSSLVARLNKQKSKLKTKVIALLKIKKDIKKQELVLLQEQRKKSRLIDSISKERKAALKKILSFKKDKNLYQDDLELLTSHFYEKKGQLAAPTSSRLLKGFGLTPGHNRGIHLSHKGHLYQWREGESVYAVAQGKVEYLGNISGYGKTLIINHGDHYYSVYSHLENISVNVGDNIAKNTVLASVKKRKDQPETGLYFELRHFSQPENPEQWLSKEEFKISLAK